MESLITQDHPKRVCDHFVQEVGKVILDKEHLVRLTLCSILSKGHVLIEDVPGVGKTTLVKTFAKLLGLQFSRIQFTNDLLPSDILGTSIFDETKKTFTFHHGPIFSQLVLGDELNRATPKTQSAFLQAMEEQIVSIDGKTYPLPAPFFLIATQNPRQQIGTFPLPESQLDRFLMRLEVGYPSTRAEAELLAGESRQSILEGLKPLFDTKQLLQLQNSASKVHTSAPVIKYIQDILHASRTQYADCAGLSPRAGLDLVSASRSWALMAGREMVLPDDVKAVAKYVIGHRLNAIDTHNLELGQHLAHEILNNVKVSH
jgi:MoxR-like ATPase